MNLKTIDRYTLPIISLLCLLLSVSCDNSDREEPPFHPEKETGNWCGTIDEYTLTTDDIVEFISESIPDVGPYYRLLSPFLCSIEIAKIKYTTTNQDGDIVEASGVITYPSDMSEYNHILSIQHGTMDINAGPSDQMFPIEAAPVFCGEMVVMADYLGYGISKTGDLKHTYMHLKTTGSACADMIQAARQYLKTKSNLKCTTDSLRLIGYSQGGQATVATLFELQRRNLADQISLVWSGAGPHNMRAYFNESIKPEKATSRKNAFMIYAIEGIIHGDRLNLDRHNIYAPEMFKDGRDSILTKLYVKQWPDIVGDDITKVLHGDVFKPDYGGNADVRTLMTHMDMNSTTNIEDAICDNIHIDFFHHPKDTYVPYCCSKSALNQWNDNSRLIDLTIANDHPAGGFEFLVRYMSSINPSYRIMELIIPYIGDVFN